MEKTVPRQKSLAADGSPAISADSWGPARIVTLERESGKSLGISIVGGKVDIYNSTNETAISGIFIKHVIPNSPAGKNGTLKTGDRILEVDHVNLRDATHDKAVEVIRNSSSPVQFVVQSLLDTSCPTDVEDGAVAVTVDSDEEHEQINGPNSVNRKSDMSQNEEVEAATKIQANFRGFMVRKSMSGKPIVNGNATESEKAASNPVIGQPSLESSESEEEDEYGYTVKSLQKKYGDLKGTLHMVEIEKGNNGLGISLAGNKDLSRMSTFVVGIHPHSVVGKDGRIKIGDELLEINGQVLYGRCHLNASAIIKSLNTPKIKLVLMRREDFMEHIAVKPLTPDRPVVDEDTTRVIMTKSKKELEDDLNNEGNENKENDVSDNKDKKSPIDFSKYPNVLTVNLKKGDVGLGFSIMEGNEEKNDGIYIKGINMGGPALEDGRLQAGDLILSVDDGIIVGVSYDKALELLRKTEGSVKLTVSQTKPSEHNTTSTKTPETPHTNENEEEEHDPTSSAIKPAQETLIELQKGKTGLGLSIVGGSDTLLGAIIVHEVYEYGAAQADGRLQSGDQILQVNDDDVRNVTHDRAIQILRQTPPTVRLLVYRDDTPTLSEQDFLDVFTVELNKKPNKGLGLSIVGKKNNVGVYISDIVKGGVAESDGRLMHGDQILAVNSEDMRNATQDYAATVLKTSMGKLILTIGRLKMTSRGSSRKNSSVDSKGLKKSESSVSTAKSKGKHGKDSSGPSNTTYLVKLQRDEKGSLGLSIAGGKGSPLGTTPVVVASVAPNGPASRCLVVGDHILAINGIPTENLAHTQCVNLLHQVKGIVTLKIIKYDTQLESNLLLSDSKKQTKNDQPPDEDSQNETIPRKIILNRGPEGLGFSIVGGFDSPQGDLPIYIKTVFAQGAAESLLKRGDQITSVNGQSLDGLTHDEAVQILKSALGRIELMVIS